MTIVTGSGQNATESQPFKQIQTALNRKHSPPGLALTGHPIDAVVGADGSLQADCDSLAAIGPIDRLVFDLDRRHRHANDPVVGPWMSNSSPSANSVSQTWISTAPALR